MCFTCSDISAEITTKNDSAFNAKHALIACGSLEPTPDEHRQRRTEKQRPEHTRDVELDRVQRHGIRQVFLFDKRRDERLIRRPAERLRKTRGERQHQDVPDLDDLEIHEEGERARGRHLDVLRPNQCAPSIVSVGQHAADQGEEDDWQLLQEHVEPEEERGIGQRQHEPVLRDDLHPRADARRAGAEPLDAEVAVGKRGEHTAQRFRAE